MKTQQLLRCIFPEILADYFDVIDIQESISQIDFWLDERNFMEKEDRKVGTVSSYGFTSERVVQDFPLRGKPVYLHVRRRKRRDSSTSEIFCKNLYGNPICFKRNCGGFILILMKIVITILVKELNATLTLHNKNQLCVSYTRVCNTNSFYESYKP